MAMGRPAIPYVMKDGTIVPGLYHCPDGRWRVNATGAKFTEHDERLAVKRFRELTHVPPELATLRGETSRADLFAEGDGWSIYNPGARVDIDTQEIWDYVRESLLHRPLYVAQRTGIPELATFANLQIPGKPLPLSAIWNYYEAENASGNKAAAKRNWERMLRQTGAKTLADLSKEALYRFRESVENDPDIKSGGTKTWMYGQIKSVLSFAKKSHDLDPVQVSQALERCSVLWTRTEAPEYKPKPIDKGHLHQLLTAAGAGPWRAWILMGLNAAMKIEEICALEWKHVDLEAGTLSMLRRKTRMPKCAVLWPETVAAIRTLRRGPVYVFTSPHGTRFTSAQSRCNEFAKLRVKAGVPDAVTFSEFRDGAYTTACGAPIQDGRLAKVLAGHATGMDDAYVLRTPEMVRPVCDAVYNHYGPFPTPG